MEIEHKRNDRHATLDVSKLFLVQIVSILYSAGLPLAGHHGHSKFLNIVCLSKLVRILDHTYKRWHSERTARYAKIGNWSVFEALDFPHFFFIFLILLYAVFWQSFLSILQSDFHIVELSV